MHTDSPIAADRRRSGAHAGWWVVLLVAGLIAGSTGGAHAATPTPTSAATRARVPAAGASPVASPGTPQPAPAVLGQVIWATAIDPSTKEPRQRVTAFPATAQTIYATLPVISIKRGTTLSASWSYNNTALPGLASSVTATADAENVWVEFHLTLKPGVPATPPLKPGTWPAGTYQITVSINGKIARTAQVMVGERKA